MLEEKTEVAAPVVKREPLPHSWLSIFAGLAVCVLATVLCSLVLNQHLKTRPLDMRRHTLALADELEQLLKENLVAPDHITRSNPQLMSDTGASWFFTSFSVEVDGPEPEGLEAVLDREMLRREVSLAKSASSEGAQELSLSIGGRQFINLRMTQAPEPEPAEAEEKDAPFNPDPAFLALAELAGLVKAHSIEPFPPIAAAAHATAPEKPKLAIILDDGGYGGPVTDAALALDPKLTIAVLPGTPYDADTARRAAELGFEVILHLPMESPEAPGWISTSMPEDEMRRLVNEALLRVPEAKGINNHMGSSFCTDDEALTRFFNVVKDRNLFFIDSRTTHETKIPQFATQAGVPVGERKTFLDNEPQFEHIREQFDQLLAFARENGSAIGIGHFRAATVDALEELLPQVEINGISLVHASEVAK